MSNATPQALGLRTHYCGALSKQHVGDVVSICGWVADRREHGEHLAFLDIRDHTGLVQCVVESSAALRPEFVVRVTGTVRLRPEGTANDALASGDVELADCTVEALNDAEPAPFVLDGHAETDEQVRLRYRYLDLRSERMQRNLRLRAGVNAAIRLAMAGQDFLEIETPLLWTPTPEGAREFAIPSRRQKGSFYVLPQSPQIAEQLTMVGGFDRYYQIARCMRDEDLRADCQFEFTQLDVEASFVTEVEIRAAITTAVTAAIEAVGNTRAYSFEEMTWNEAIDTYGSDKPDLRFEMKLCDLSSVFSTTEFNAFKAPAVRSITVSEGASFNRSRLDSTVDRAKELGAKGLVWMRVIEAEDGRDLESPITKFLRDDERHGILEATQASVGDLVLIVADERRLVCDVLGQLRVDLGRPPVGEGDLRFCWVIDFPLFDGVDDEGHPVAAHHPFTMPHADDLDAIESDPASVRAQSYDLVLNGWELGSGSIRIHRADIQARVFSCLGITPEEADERFGFLLGAFRYGAPPHGGFAVGLDRLVAILAGEENIREVIVFPKTQSGTDLMTGAPRAIGPRQLRELGIRVDGTDKAPMTSAPS